LFLCTAALLHWRAAAEFAAVLARATHFGVGVWQHQTQREVRNGEQVSTFLVSVVEVTNQLSACPPIELPAAYETPLFESS
jgi:hypothetical protein